MTNHQNVNVNNEASDVNAKRLNVVKNLTYRELEI